MLEEIEREYNRLRSEGLNTWAEYPHPGNLRGAAYDRRLALSFGVRYTATRRMQGLLDGLTKLREDDELDVVQDLHVTFLACTRQVYETIEDLPLAAFLTNDLPASIRLNCLRLIPIQDGLVLAGLPDAEAIEARATIAGELLGRPEAAKLLRERYGKYPIPPLLWHTTLVRCRHEYAKKSVRDLFARHATVDFNSLDIGPIRLCAIDFDWRFCEPVTIV